VVTDDAIGADSHHTFIFQIDEGHAAPVNVHAIRSVGGNTAVEGKDAIRPGNEECS
jgi:hypothetical protein